MIRAKSYFVTRMNLVHSPQARHYSFISLLTVKTPYTTVNNNIHGRQ